MRLDTIGSVGHNPCKKNCDAYLHIYRVTHHFYLQVKYFQLQETEIFLRQFSKLILVTLNSIHGNKVDLS